MTSSGRFNSRRWATSRRRANKTRRARLPISSIATREDQCRIIGFFDVRETIRPYRIGLGKKNHAYCWLCGSDLRITACKNNVIWGLITSAVSLRFIFHITFWFVYIHVAYVFFILLPFTRCCFLRFNKSAHI